MVTRPQSPSERDLELLSAYLDGELSDRERAALEKRLSQDIALRTALDGLRDTVVLVQSLPRLKAPRNFTLDPAVYGQPVSWWRRLFTLGAVLQVSGAFGAAASIMIIALAFLLSGQSGSEDRTALIQPPGANSAATAVGYAAGTVLPTTVEYAAGAVLPTASQPPAVFPTAVIAQAFTPTQRQSATENMREEGQDGAVSGGAADSAAMPSAEAEVEAVILIDPVTSEQDASVPPPAPGEQPAEESATFGDTADNGVFAAAPEIAGTPTSEAVAAQAYDDTGEAEEPSAIATTGTPAVAAFEQTTASVTPLSISAQPADETTTAGREKNYSGEEAIQDVQDATEEEDNSTRWLVAGLGAAVFVLSAGLFIVGRRRR